MANFKQKVSVAAANVLTTGLDALANGSAAISAAIAQATNLDLAGWFELIIPAYAGAASPAAGAPISLYLIKSLDSATFEDGSATVLPPTPDYVFTTLVRASLRQVTQYAIPLPGADFKAILRNDSGLNFGANGNILRLLTMQEQSV